MQKASGELSDDVDQDCERFLQGFPSDWEAKMRALGALTSAGKIASPQDLLRAIFLSCGLDQSLRDVAGTLT